MATINRTIDLDDEKGLRSTGGLRINTRRNPNVISSICGRDLSFWRFVSNSMYPISPDDLAYARKEFPKDGPLSPGMYTSAGLAYTEKGKPLLLFYHPDAPWHRTQPLLNKDLAEKAAHANLNQRYYSVEGTAIYDEVSWSAIWEARFCTRERSAVILPSDRSFDISITEHSQVFNALFGDMGPYYLQYLGLKKLHFNLLEKNDPKFKESILPGGTIFTQLWMGPIQKGRHSSALSGKELSLHQTNLSCWIYNCY